MSNCSLFTVIVAALLVSISIRTTSARRYDKQDATKLVRQITELLRSNDPPFRSSLADHVRYCFDNDCAAGVRDTMDLVASFVIPEERLVGVVANHKNHVFKDDLFSFDWQITYQIKVQSVHERDVCWLIQTGNCIVSYTPSGLQLESDCVIAPQSIYIDACTPEEIAGTTP